MWKGVTIKELNIKTDACYHNIIEQCGSWECNHEIMSPTQCMFRSDMISMKIYKLMIICSHVCESVYLSRNYLLNNLNQVPWELIIEGVGNQCRPGFRFLEIYYNWLLPCCRHLEACCSDSSLWLITTSWPTLTYFSRTSSHNFFVYIIFCIWANISIGILQNLVEIYDVRSCANAC